MKTTTVNISDELKRKLESVPEGMNTKKRIWTAEEDAAILEYYPIKHKDDLAKAFGVSFNTLLKRYKELTNE